MQVPQRQVFIYIFVTLIFIGQFEAAPMEERDQAKHLYKKARDNDSLGPAQQADIRQTVTKLISRSLNRLDYKSRFRYKQFPSIIKKTALCGKFVAQKTSAAFILLEKYLILLLTFPWKTEFHKLKTYCGFFQCKVKSHLEDAENVFKLIGFRESDNNTLVMVGECDLELISDVAFECLVASVECDLISDYHKQISEEGGTILHAITFRLEGRKPELSERKASEHVDYVNNHPHWIECSDTARHELQQRGVCVENAVPDVPMGLPFIDDDLSDTAVEVPPAFQMGTVDEHMMASLQKLSAQPARSVGGGRPCQEDWSYVRDSLVRKYGKAYYDGIRGDVINPDIGRRVDMPARIPEERDNVSDEGIDVYESPPARLDPANRKVHRLPHSAADPSLFTVQTKSLGTSGYRTGMYTPQMTASYPPNAAVCDESPLSPVKSKPSLSSDSNVVSQPVPRTALPPAEAVAVHTVTPGLSNFVQHSNTNNLSNIKLWSRVGAQSGAFQMEEIVTRGPGVSHMEQSGGRWKCQSCTIENVPGLKICQVCGKSRFAPVDMDGPQSGVSVKVCEKCTFENKPGSKVCGACDTQLIHNNINTYV